MDVACSTACFTREPFEQALRHIAEMEFGKIDLAIADTGAHISPREVLADATGVVQRLRQGPTIGMAAITFRTGATGETFDAQFEAAAHLAAQLAAPVLVIEAAANTTPFDLEVERLRNLERIASLHATILTVTTKTGTWTELPANAVRLCERVPGLGLTLDPSHFICGPHRGGSYDEAFPYVRNVHLRDSGRRMDQLQVMVGRGEIEYGRIVTSLTRYNFAGSLVVAMEDTPAPDFDVEVEVRKLRLLLESLI